MTEIPATSPPGAPGAPGVPAEHRLTVLSGHRPAHVLACWGLTFLKMILSIYCTKILRISIL